MKYKIYYCLESSVEYLSSKDAKPQSDLQGLLELLQRLLDPDDLIYLYEISSAKRVRFRLVSESELAVSHGVQEISLSKVLGFIRCWSPALRRCCETIRGNSDFPAAAFEA